MKNVLLVGGGPLIIGKLRRDLATLGLHVAWWWGEADRSIARATSLPAGCDAVVVLSDTAAHEITNRGIALARAAGVKFVRIHRGWSIGRQQCLRAGVGDPDYVHAPEPKPPEPESEPEIEPEPEPEQVNGVAVGWAAGKSRNELLIVLKDVVAELITGHHCANFKITNEGKITLDVQESLDLDSLLRDDTPEEGK